jgi:CBS domain-containing protein
MMKSIVKDIMTTHVVAVRAGATFKEMAAKLHEERVSAFPVLDNGGIVIGVVSEGDMLPKEALDDKLPGMPGMIAGILHRKDQEKAEGITAADLMTAPAVTVAPDDTVEHAARLMYSRRVKRLPVTDAAGHLVGIISRADVLSVFDRPDEEIRKEILNDVILSEFLTNPSRYTVTVKDGIVTMEGRPESATLGRDIVDQVRHVQGVVSVRDRLDYPPSERSSPGPFY